MGWKGFSDVQATIHIDLGLSLDELWNNLDKDARWGVNRAKKEGLVVKEAADNEWDDFYGIYKDTCIRGGIVPLSFDEIKKSKLLVCKKENKIIAGAAVKEKGEVIELFLNSSLFDFLKFQPNNLLYWSIIEYGKKNGFKTFDLGGFQLNANKGSKLYEINRFKERWGGKIITYNIYSRNPLYILGRKVIRNIPLMKKLRDKLRMKKAKVQAI